MRRGSALRLAAALFLLLLSAPFFLAPNVSEAGEGCIRYAVCLSCTNTTQKPCVVEECPTGVTVLCGTCVNACVPPSL